MKSKVVVDRWLVLANSSSSAIAYALNVSVLLWLHQYLLRRISVEEYAIYPVVMGVIAFVPVLSSVLLAGLGRFAVHAHARDDAQRVTEIVSTMFPLLSAAGLALLLGSAIVAWQAEAVLAVDPTRVFDARIMLMLLALTAATRLALTPFGIGLFVRQRFVVLNLIQTAGNILRLGMLLVLLLGIGPRIIWVVVASTATDLAVVVAQLLYSRRMLPELRFARDAFRWSVARELTSFGTWNLVINVAALVRTSAQPIILLHYATPLDVTCFGLAALAVTEIQRVTQLVAAPLQPALTALHACGDVDGLRKAFLRGNRYALWFILLVVTPALIYRKELVDLYVGSKFTLAAFVLFGMLLTMPLRYAAFMASHLLTAEARLKPIAMCVVATQGLTLILTIVLVIPFQMGAAGAAIAALAAGTICPPLLLWPLGWRTARVDARRWLRESILPGALPGLVAGPVWLALRMLTSPATWMGLALCIVIGLVVYAMVLIAFCLQPHERSDLRRIWAVARGVRRAGTPVDAASDARNTSP